MKKKIPIPKWIELWQGIDLVFMGMGIDIFLCLERLTVDSEMTKFCQARTQTKENFRFTKLNCSTRFLARKCPRNHHFYEDLFRSNYVGLKLKIFSGNLVQSLPNSLFWLKLSGHTSVLHSGVVCIAEKLPVV